MKSQFRNNYSKLSDTELLAKVIGEGEARLFFENGGTLESLFSANNGKIEIFAIFNELFNRYLEADLLEGDYFTSPDKVKKYLLRYFAGQEYESFVVIFLSAQHCILDVVEMFRGTLSQTSVHPREVVKFALERNAASIIVSHNHPSGTLEESLADKNITKHLQEALSFVDVKVLDHILIAGNSAMSFAEKGIMF